MPYVIQERRPALDKVVKYLLESNGICNNAGIVDNMKFSSTLLRITNAILDKKSTEDEITTYIRSSGLKIDGDLNYVLFKYCKYNIPKSYNNIKNYCGELNECVAEIRRKLLAKYEDLKEKENGEV